MAEELTQAVTASSSAEAESRGFRPCACCPAQDLSVCHNLKRDDLQRLFPNGLHPTERKAGTVLFRQGEPFERFLIVRSGWVVTHKDFDDGQRQIVRFVLPGGMIGFERLGGAGTATGMAFGGEAITDVNLCVVPATQFVRACALSPRLAAAFAESAAREAVSAWNHVSALGHRTAQGRIASLLLDLCRRVGARWDVPGTAADLPISQIHIADATGLTPVHVCRTLKRMRLDGLLRFQKGRLILLDPDRVAALAQLDALGPSMNAIDAADPEAEGAIDPPIIRGASAARSHGQRPV